jgi:hypothetical protein
MNTLTKLHFPQGLASASRPAPDAFSAPEGAWCAEDTAALDRVPVSDELGTGVLRLMAAVFAVSLVAGLAVGMWVA